MDFSETIVVFDLKLATDDRSDKKFLLTSKFCILGAVSPLPRGYIHVLNHENICIKSDLYTIRCGIKKNIKYIHVLNHENICIKSDLYTIRCGIDCISS